MIQRVRSVRGVAITLAVVITASNGSTAEQTGLAWDYWVPREELSAAQLARMPEYCAGAYQWPLFPHPLSKKTEDFPIEAEARHAEYWRSGEVVLDGDVVVTQGNRTLSTSSATLNHESREGHISGLVHIAEPDVILTGTDARMNLDTKATSLNDAEFLLIEPELRGSAAQLNRDDEGNMRLTSGIFTRCEPDNNNWRIGSGSFEIKDGSDYGTARNAVIRVKNVPIFYTPYISFPINDERKSGWLFPHMSFGSLSGFDFTPPFYLNLAPNYDATIAPRYIQKRGLGVEGEFRHLSSWQKTTVAGAFLKDDKIYNGTYSKDDFDRLSDAGLLSGPFIPADRWLYAMYHQGDFSNWRTTVDYTAVSDRDYFRNLGNGLDVSSRRELERFGEIQYNLGGLGMRLWAQRFDRLDSVQVDPYQRLPELDLNYIGVTGPVEWTMRASAVSFDRDNDDLSGVARIVGDRVHVEPRVRVPMLRSWGFMTLMGGYRHTAYSLRDTSPEVDSHPERNIGLGSVDAGLFFERDVSFFQSSVTQTLEPRIYYLYQQYEDQDDLPRFDVGRLSFRYDQLWRDNRFSGLDRIGDADQMSVGLTSRFIDTATGRELLRANLGQIRYFRDRRVSLTGVQLDSDLTNGSQLAADLLGRMGKWSVGGNLIWNPNTHQVNEGGAFTRFRSDNDHILHLGYRYRRSAVVDQTDMAFIWPLTHRYSLIGRWNYDLRTRRTIEGLAGIEYNDCCWQIRVVARQYLDKPAAIDFEAAETEYGIFLQVVFKGLAGLGNSLESRLSKSIPGYSLEN